MGRIHIGTINQRFQQELLCKAQDDQITSDLNLFHYLCEVKKAHSLKFPLVTVVR
jgi:hypothetical protein